MTEPHYVDVEADDDGEETRIFNLKMPKRLHRDLKAEAALFDSTLRQVILKRLAAGGSLASRRGIY
jgi:hypothetical protein